MEVTYMHKRWIAGALAVFLACQTPVQAMSTDEASDKIKDMMDFIMENYAVEEVTEEDLYEAALKGMFDKLDKYTDVYTDKEYKELIQSVSGNYSGIGSYIKEVDGLIMISKPMKGSPAEKAGLLPNDLILKVDGIDLKTLTYEEGIGKIKGPEGTEVTLLIRRGDKEKTIKVRRASIQVSAVNYSKLKDLRPETEAKNANKIGYVDIDSFNATVAKDFGAALKDAKKDGMKGLIIDVRDNLGGYLGQVIEMCKMVVPEGPIVWTVDKTGQEEVYLSDLKEKPFKLIVLTNKASASASEIFTGAIKDSDAGIIVGDTTYGKGVVQRIYDQQGTRFKMTVQEYLTRDKNHINGVGIEPHLKVVVPSYMPDNNKRLKPGTEDELVMTLEEILVYLGYMEKADSVYDEVTAEAIKKIQKVGELEVDGIADYDTMAKLNGLLAEDKVVNDPVLDKAIRIMDNLVKY